jgi:hypothetical protein
VSREIDFDLNTMRAVDVAAVDRAELVDLRDIMLKAALPQRERLIDFIRQVRNPYCQKYKNMVIKQGFSDTDKTMEDILESHFLSL